MGYALNNPYFVQKSFNLLALGSAPGSILDSTPGIAPKNIDTKGNTGGTIGGTIGGTTGDTIGVMRPGPVPRQIPRSQIISPKKIFCNFPRYYPQ